MILRLTKIWIGRCAIVFAVIGVLGAHGIADAGEKGIEAGWVSRIISLQGEVLVKRQGQTHWGPVKLNDAFFAGDQIRVESNSRAGIVLSNDAVMRLDQNTALIFTEIEQKRTFIFNLLDGAANFFSHRPHSLKILTPFVNGVVEGTEFFVQVDAAQTRIDLFEGRILAENDYGILDLAKGEGAVAPAGKAPQRYFLVRPRESVQWAMYYPPVLALGTGVASADINQSLALFEDGQVVDALARLESIEPGSREATFFVCRAAMLLHVGGIAKAQSDIQQALTLDPENGDALALKAVIAVVQNRAADAVDMARQAVKVSPQSASAHIALSYALQGAFKLPEALDAAREAVTQATGSGLAWARLADLQLSVGALDKGVSTAQKAVALAPRTAHAHTILGFAHLTRIETKNARESFNEAIALDSAAPLPRLGLGLADIRDGALEKGRAEIEIAAGLDPGNSLIRSYLGKAYFDEKRDPLDGQQFDIAKSLDPNDPTPWFYDAIRKQSINRPVEALKDLQKSIALNDNRAVYRSRLLLDEDLGARSASLGRIYNNLDFQELAIREGSSSLNADTANYSAHRLLADTYASRPRHEIARVSELLQAQLLQPLNITPIQPQLAETNLFIFQGAGPAEPSYNEYNPLFNRDRVALQVSGTAGNKDTIGDEVVLSAVEKNVSFSVGQFYYQTDGFRENNDLKHNIYNAFTQIGLSHKTSIQAELRSRDTQRGDPFLRFDPENYVTTARRPQKIRSGRFGFHHQFSPASDLIGSWIYTDAESQFTIPAFLEAETLDDGYLGEIQHLFNGRTFHLTTGAGYLNGNRETSFSFFVPIPSLREQSEIEHLLGYVYSSMNLPFDMTWTLGLSANKFSGFVDRKQFNPKIGVSWNIFEKTTMRAAAFRVLEDTLIAKQRLEPTQVAGFNQFFEEVLDGGEAVDVWNYGIGVDQQIFDMLSGGIEFVRRNREVPYLDLFNSRTAEVEWDEDTLRVYFYATPWNWLALDFGYQFESFERDEEYVGDDDFIELDTHRFPLGIRFFSPTGLFAGAKATYVDQEGRIGNRDSNYSDEDDFWVVDASVGYRLPRRLGIISVEGKNIFDETFKFQDTDPSRPTIFPDRQILVKLTLSF